MMTLLCLLGLANESQARQATASSPPPLLPAGFTPITELDAIASSGANAPTTLQRRALTRLDSFLGTARPDNGCSLRIVPIGEPDPASAPEYGTLQAFAKADLLVFGVVDAMTPSLHGNDIGTLLTLSIVESNTPIDATPRHLFLHRAAFTYRGTNYCIHPGDASPRLPTLQTVFYVAVPAQRVRNGTIFPIGPFEFIPIVPASTFPVDAPLDTQLSLSHLHEAFLSALSRYRS